MKVYRKKRRSCGPCKPNKVGAAPRYKAKELMLRRLAEKAGHEYCNRH